MSVNIIDTLAQKNGGDFAVVDSNDVGGGYWQVANSAERIAISAASYRKNGMLVFQQDDRSTWRLGADLATWEAASLGGGSGLSADVTVYVHPITGTDAPGSDRPAALTGGTYTRPFMSISAARDAIGSNLGRYHASVILAATAFDEGAVFQGMTGPAKGLRLYGTWGTAALTAVAGTGTSTSQVQRLGGSAWTPGAYKDKFFVPTSGGGYVDAGPNEAGAIINDNDANYLYLRQPVAGIDSTTNYQIVNNGTTIAGVADETYPDLSFFTMGLGFLDMSVEAVVRRIKFDNSAVGFFGLFTEANALVDVRLCEFASGEHWLTYDKHLNLNDSVVSGGAHIFAYGETKIDSYGTVIDGAQLELDTYDKATIDYATFRGCTATAFKASYGDDLTLGAEVKNNVTTPIYLRNFGYARLGTLGLSGANPSAHYAFDLGGNGIAELAGAVVSASGTNQVLIEGREVSYTTLGAHGTTRKKGTAVVWGSGDEYLLEKIYVKVDPNNPGDEIATDGDGVFGGQTKNYGFDNELGAAYDTSLAAAGTAYSTAAAISYRSTVVDSAAATANGIRLLYGGVDANSGGHTGKIYNVSGYDLALWPAYTPAGVSPAATGSINGGSAGASAFFPNNHVAIYNSVAEASHRVAFVPMTTGLTEMQRFQYFGDGSDGTVSITGATTLQRDMYYDSLTVSGSGALTTNGYAIFVKNTLDLSSAAAGAIQWVGVSATPPTTNAGGTGQTITSTTTLGTPHFTAGHTACAGGGAGTTPAAGGSTSNLVYATGAAGTGGAGGASSSGAAGGAGGNITSSVQRLLRVVGPQLYATQPAVNGSVFGRTFPGTGGGGGRMTASGGTTGGGGGGGAPGGQIGIYARIIKRDSSGTATAAIRAVGSAGAAGANGNTDGSGNAQGAGGGGGGGAGGFVHVVYEQLQGTSKTAMIDVSGGVGGAGGNCVAGTPASATGGTGGNGGGGGAVHIEKACVSVAVTTGTTGSAGSAPSGVTGGAGGAGETLQVTL